MASTDNPDFGGCRHCGHTPVHATARACPYCGGIAPYTRTPPRRNNSGLIMLAIVTLVVLASLLAFYIKTS